MRRYANLSGDSGVVAYEVGRDSIDVKFQDGWIYLYTYASAGALHVEAMKKLAAAGRGLCTYIVKNARKSYESKHR
jgi:hypothetical protein